MKSAYLWISLAALAIIACGAFAYLGCAVAVYAACAVALLALVMFYRATSKPMNAIRTGMDLLRSQDFASRLRRTGNKDADEVANLYNSIISNIKAERLKNLEQNKFLGKLIEVSPMGIAICSLDGVIETTNPAFDAFSSPYLLKTLASLPDNGQCTIRPEGTQVMRCARLSFMDRGFRRPFYLVERLTDEIVRAEASIFSKVVRTIGHEVNNTLGGVISILETFAEIHSDDPETVAAVESCRTSCVNLGSFVKGYSDIVKLPDPEIEPVDINQFVAESLPFLSEMCPAGISIHADLHPDAGIVPFDSMLIHRVLVNAVKNSIESIAPAEGLITVRTAPGMLEIIDNGRGISEENARRIFSPFFSTKHVDRGLGLMLISDILRRHKATFSLSTDTDHLTRLSITFPR